MKEIPVSKLRNMRFDQTIEKLKEEKALRITYHNKPIGVLLSEEVFKDPMAYMTILLTPDG